jgi:Flp pilus assembly pilin Flp
MTKLYVYTQVWMADLARKLRREEGAEAIEYLGMAVVIAMLMGLVLTVVKSQGKSIGEIIVNAIANFLGGLISAGGG